MHKVWKSWGVVVDNFGLVRFFSPQSFGDNIGCGKGTPLFRVLPVVCATSFPHINRVFTPVVNSFSYFSAGFITKTTLLNKYYSY